MNNTSKKIAGGFIGLAAALVMSIGSVAPAMAAAPAALPPPRPVVSIRPDNGPIERENRELQAWSVKQQQHLDHNVQVTAVNVQKFITAQQAKGQDTSALTAALNIFNAQIASSQSIHNVAVSVLAAHAGFNADGSVINVAAARRTNAAARQSLTDARRIKWQAREDLFRAIRNWTKNNHTPEPAPVESNDLTTN